MSGKTLLLVVAAAVVWYIGVMHSILGERYVLRRLLELPDLPLLRKDPLFTKNVLRWAWHLTSLAWVGLATLLVALALAPWDGARVTAGMVSIILLASGIIVLAGIGLRHPAWPLFLAAGTATAIAAALM
jgi:hypothetical protein